MSEPQHADQPERWPIAVDGVSTVDDADTIGRDQREESFPIRAVQGRIGFGGGDECDGCWRLGDESW